MRHTPIPANYLLTALSVVGLLLSSPPAVGSSLIHENVETRDMGGDVDARMPALKRMASMQISGPKPIKDVDAKAFAQTSEPNDSRSKETKAAGCYMNKVWYPEGAIYPPQEPGQITATVVIYVCRAGKWIIRGNAD